MALGKYSRVDGRKSSNYCSTLTMVVFVALCLVGVWMMTSSSVVPDVEKKNDLPTQITGSKGGSASSNNAGDESNPTDEGKSKQFEDTPGDLPEDATKGDAAVSQEESHSNPQQTESTSEVKQEEKMTEQKEDAGDSKSETQSERETDNSDEKKEDGKFKLDDKDSETGEKSENKSVGVAIEEGSDEKKSVENSAELNDKKDQEVDLDSDNKADGQGQKKDQSSNEASESKDEKEMQKSSGSDKENSYIWKLCNSTAGPDYIPCLDNLEAIRNLRSTKHYEHRERHCPDKPPTCLVPLPEGYQRPVEWPTSREKIWYHNVPHTKLAEVKGHQNWVKVSGEYTTFPGGGTQFKHGALHYIDFIQQSAPVIAWGNRTRVVLDVGCGVASFGGYLFEKDVLTMSLAPKDEHEAQVQFALERGIPAISAVMGTKRLPFPSRVFDLVHCARCRVPWHIEGGKLLLELNRVLRPGGLFVWSATPVYQKLPEDVEIWEAMSKLTNAMCWELIAKTKDRVNGVGAAVYRKPTSNECYEQRSTDAPPLCQGYDDPNAAWNVPLQACMHKAPVATSERGSQWPESWPARLSKSPYWLLSSEVGVYGKPAPEDFTADYEHWKHVVTNSYLKGMGINWSTVRNVMDMRAIYGGFAAALRDLNVWVMNVVSVDAPDTLPIIYERGLFGIYHDWCESFSTYPRSYDLVHADHLFSKIKTKCGLPAIVAEVDRILRPEGKLIVRDKAETITELESIFKSMHYEIHMTYSKDKEGLLFCQKTMWRPKDVETLTYAIA
ncbi:unnamed protein product [Withania somnifera]